jgi:chlorite dismutase
MAEETRRSFNHFAFLRFTERHWAQEPEVRRRAVGSAVAELRKGVAALHLYQVFGVESGPDLLIWTAVDGNDTGIAARVFTHLARTLTPIRHAVTLTTALWGLTQPSQYTKTKSRQEIDPFVPERLPYLVMYPFTKTAEWYQRERDERRDMMMEHIKIGKQYEDITQLLLYSTGLQDQEFVVVYETVDLTRFSNLVTDLRSTRGRPFTERDTPLHTAVHQADWSAAATWV